MLKKWRTCFVRQKNLFWYHMWVVTGSECTSTTINKQDKNIRREESGKKCCFFLFLIPLPVMFPLHLRTLFRCLVIYWLAQILSWIYEDLLWNPSIQCWCEFILRFKYLNCCFCVRASELWVWTCVEVNIWINSCEQCCVNALIMCPQGHSNTKPLHLHTGI